MGREKEGYRDNMALLNKRFPGKDMLTRDDVAVFMGVSKRTVARNISFPSCCKYITKSDLARQVTV